MHTDILIIGGGLAGLALADMLITAGHDVLLVEARARLGGRIETATFENAAFDLGPAWFWDGQPRIAALIERFGLNRFEQFATGDLIFEDQRGVQRGQGYASMQGSYRLKDGLTALITAFERTLPAAHTLKSTQVTHIMAEADKITVTASGKMIKANRVALAIPPRIAAQIAFDPPLSKDATAALQAIPTWMAGQAKAVAIYERSPWRDAGLSGDAMSRLGPMVEIHDASPASGGPYALFGFIGVTPEVRQNEADIRDAVVAQLARLFGREAADPRALFIKDWAFDPFTATDVDKLPLMAHPQYGLPSALTQLWQERLLFGGTEVAPQFGGFLEGALEAAEIAFAALTSESKNQP